MDLHLIKQRIAAGKLDAVEDAWIAAMEQNAALDEFREVAAVLVEAEQAEQAQTLAWMLLSERVEQAPPAEALAAARAVLPTVAGTAELREAAAGLYQQVHGQAEHDLLANDETRSERASRPAVWPLGS